MHGKTVSEWEWGQMLSRCSLCRRRDLNGSSKIFHLPEDQAGPPKMVPLLRFPHLPLLTQTVIKADPNPSLWGHLAVEFG